MILRLWIVLLQRLITKFHTTTKSSKSSSVVDPSNSAVAVQLQLDNSDPLVIRKLTEKSEMRKHFGGLFVASRKDRLNDEDKVKLLSVVSQNLESDDCSSVSTASDNNSDKLRLLQVDHYGDPTTSDSDPSDNRNLSPTGHVGVNTNSEGFANGGADLTSSQEFLDCPTFVTPTVTKSPPIPPPKQPTDVWSTEGSADKQEWIFTLYDFDGKGKVSHDDIVSLVRSIYEVLGQVKIPTTTETPKNSQSNMGAFRIRLTVVKDKPMGKHPQMYGEPAEMDISCLTEFPSNDHQKRVSKRGHYASPNVTHLTSQEPPTVGVENHNNKQRSTYASIEEVLGLSNNKRIKRQTPKTTGKNVTYAVPTSRRHSYLHQQQSRNPADITQNRDENVCPTAEKPRNCHCCEPTVSTNGRDYVNLSELENCCTKGVTNCANGEIHHIRHCDRHCACLPRLQRNRQYSELLNCSRNGVVSPPVANGFCCQQQPTSTPAAVNKAVNEALREAQQSQYGRHHSRQLRNFAYYSHQMAKMSKSPGETPVRPAPIGSSSPIYAAINTQPEVTSIPPQPQHIRKPHLQQKQKEKLRSMAAVKEWITKEPFELCPPPNNSENPYDIPTKILHEHHHYHHYA